MMTLYVQFSDANGTSIIAYFGCEQDSSAYENLGTVEMSDARWATFYEAMNAAGLANGLPVPASS